MFCKILTKIVIFQNYFRKLSFLNNKFVRSFIRPKINSILHISFAVAAVETLAGVATCGEGEGGGGLEVHMNLMLPEVSKVIFFHNLDLPGGPGGFLWKAQEPSKFLFLILVMKKYTYNVIFGRRLLKTKYFLDNRLGLHIFSK